MDAFVPYLIPAVVALVFVAATVWIVYINLRQPKPETATFIESEDVDPSWCRQNSNSEKRSRYTRRAARKDCSSCSRKDSNRASAKRIGAERREASRSTAGARNRNTARRNQRPISKTYKQDAAQRRRIQVRQDASLKSRYDYRYAAASIHSGAGAPLCK